MSQILEKPYSKTMENIINIKFNFFDIKYGIYFTLETDSLVLCTHENVKNFCFTHEINSIFNMKPLNILYIHLFKCQDEYND